MYKTSEHLSPRLQRQLETFRDMKHAKDVYETFWVCCAAFATIPAASCWQIIGAMFS